MNPTIVLPAIEAARPMVEVDGSSSELRFWEIADPDLLSTYIEQLAIELDGLRLEAAEYRELPLGYGVTRYVMRFEFHRAIDSWLAVENVGADDMQLVRYYYQRMGLAPEAEALEKAEAAWYEGGGHEASGYERADAMYYSFDNPHNDPDKRWAFLVGALRSETLWQA
jgi:hypothetical protein